MVAYQCSICGKACSGRRRRTCGLTACIRAAVSKGQLAGGALSATRAKKIRAMPYVEAEVYFVPLTQGAFTKIDVRDAPTVMQKCWYLYREPRTGRKYAVREELGKTVRLHRWLLNADHSDDVDHANGDGLDNRRENLRRATSAQNARNAHKRAQCTSQYKGVNWDANGRLSWRARIRVDRKLIHIGRFATEEEAARAYDEAARRLHGEFARVNFPVDEERPALH